MTGRGGLWLCGLRRALWLCAAQIGYFGRPFETKKLREIQGDEKDYLRFVLGQQPNLMTLTLTHPDPNPNPTPTLTPNPPGPTLALTLARSEAQQMIPALEEGVATMAEGGGASSSCRPPSATPRATRSTTRSG